MPDLIISTNATPVAVSVEPSAKETLRQAGIAVAAGNAAATSEAVALAAAGPNYASIADGNAATTTGETFAVDNGDETISVYAHGAASSDDALRTMPKDTLALFAADTGAALVGGIALPVATRSLLKAITTAKQIDAFLCEGERFGYFRWDASDLSSDVTGDPEEGIYIAPSDGSTGAWVRQGVREVACEWFGAVAGGDARGNATALQAACAYAVATDFGNVTLGLGQYDLDTTIALTTHGIAIVGRDSSKQTGSSDAHATVINWTGGASPMFTCSNTYPVFKNLGIQNTGTATDVIEMNSGSQGLWLENCSFVVPSGATAFSRSIIRSNGNRAGYTVIRHVNAKSCAPEFISIDGQAVAQGNTDILIDGGSVFDSSTAPMTVVKLMDSRIEQVKIRDCTFITNTTGNELCIVDTASNTPDGDVPKDPSINILDFSNNEIDKSVAGTATWRYFKLKNVRNIRFDNNEIDPGGTITALATLSNSHVTSCRGNRATSITGPFFEAGLAFTSGGTTAIAVGDTITGATSGHTAVVTRVDLQSGSWAGGDAAGTLGLTNCAGTFAAAEALNVGASSDLATVTAAISSTVSTGPNYMERSSTQGVFSFSAGGVVPLAYAATTDVELPFGNERPTVFTVDVSNATNFTLTLRNQANYARPDPGTVFTYIVRNKSGGAMGSTQIRFNTSHTLIGGATNLGASPANGYSRSITFMWDGIKAIELSRSSADVANS